MILNIISIDSVPIFPFATNNRLKSFMDGVSSGTTVQEVIFELLQKNFSRLDVDENPTSIE
jgi:hypothetical protein